MSDLKPCPFCGQSLEQPYLKNPEVYRHPENPDCFAGKGVVHPENYAAWDRRALPAVQPGHVNETPKSEHDAANMLTPATKGGA